MDLTYQPIEGKSRGYRIMIAILAILVAGLVVSFLVVYLSGQQVFGTSNAIPWGTPIVMAIYLIGLSAGSLILSSLTYVFGREEYKPIARMAVYLAIVLIFGAMVFIFVDLGRPEKFWRLFMYGYLSNMTSMFAINSILYGSYFVISLVYLGFILANQLKFTRVLGIIAVGWAVIVHMGTGAIFGFVAARETWFSPIKPFEFLAAALASGLALLILAVVFTLKFSGRGVKRETITPLGHLLSLFIIILFILVFVDKLTHLYAPAREATLFMLTGHFSWIFWVFQIGMGVVIPLAILLHPRSGKTIGGVTIAAVSVVIGVFFERYYLVVPGAAYPMPIYPGKIEGVWGVTGSFSITPVETALSVGIVALVALLFVLGLKYLELLPANEGSATSVTAEASVAEGKA